ncbi:MAG: SdrD B-like domain-containing protein [Deltaproteobacteria bacterium]|nr:SdrD B-like domain-containing protein [Deltaproteobacteria bacterium]
MKGKQVRMRRGRSVIKGALVFGCMLCLGSMFGTNAEAFTLNVVGSDGADVGAFRWLLEEDNTNLTVPGAPVADSVSNDIHNSYAPVVTQGTSGASSTSVNIPASLSGKRFYISVLPMDGYGMGGSSVSVGQETVKVVVEPLSWPTAQFSVYAFMDHNLINDGPDPTEQGLGGAGVTVFDAGGQVFYDAYGNLLGTIYEEGADGTILLDGNGVPVVKKLGNGVVRTLTQYDFERASDPNHPDYDPEVNPYGLQVGEALVKYIVPGKYGIRVMPPREDDNGMTMEWTQTTTIEGTPTIDAWVKANEPESFVEGFGAGFWHAAFGFVKLAPVSSPYKGQTLDVLPWNMTAPQGSGSIEGTLRVNHFSRPPHLQGYFPGEPVKEGWIGLNDPNVQPAATPAGLYVTACDPNTGYFKINNVPAGTYTLVHWDEPLDMLFGFKTVEVRANETVDLGDILVFQWFGHINGKVFYDTNQNGFPDAGEAGIAEQGMTLRFRDGTIYQGTATNQMGEYSFPEVFPFFKWLVLEVDFLRFKATGMTSVVDYGGVVLPDEGWDYPSRDKLFPQPQSEGHPPTATITNPNTGNNLSRTETGEVLTQAVHTFLGQYNEVNWGKVDYTGVENGGISGIVYYATTRASDDPRLDTAEPWEPGIPRVQVNLYRDANKDGVIDEIPSDIDRYPFLFKSLGIVGPEDTDWNNNGEYDEAVPGIQVPDVDNYPFQWTDEAYSGYTGKPGVEDVDRLTVGKFDLGDALQVTTTDSWDDNKPSGCIQDLPVVHGVQIEECADAFGTWNQVRPGLFDGGYAFGDVELGTYIVEVVPPRSTTGQDMYAVARSQDKNVDFGVEWNPSPKGAETNDDIILNPPVCVGPSYVVPEFLTLFPGVEAPLAGETLPHCNMKQVNVLQTRNAAADFFLKTDVPKAARVVGFVNNDLGAEFNMGSPNYGEKLAAPWIPIAFRDWAGHEFQRIYSDEYGGYNALLTSTFTNNVASPSGMSPNMITLVLNDPTLPDGTEDPYYNPLYSVTPWTFEYYPGAITYTDTPLVPLAAFASSNQVIDTEPPDQTPVMASVTGPESQAGPLLCTARPNGSTITISSVGDKLVLNPDYNPQVPGSPFKIIRHYGFGDVQGRVTLGGEQIPVDSWTNQQIRATVPASASTGTLMVTRGDNAKTTEIRGYPQHRELRYNPGGCRTRRLWYYPGGHRCPLHQGRCHCPGGPRCIQ